MQNAKGRGSSAKRNNSGIERKGQAGIGDSAISGKLVRMAWYKGEINERKAGRWWFRSMGETGKEWIGSSSTSKKIRAAKVSDALEKSKSSARLKNGRELCSPKERRNTTA